MWRWPMSWSQIELVVLKCNQGGRKSPMKWRPTCLLFAHGKIKHNANIWGKYCHYNVKLQSLLNKQTGWLLKDGKDSASMPGARLPGGEEGQASVGMLLPALSSSNILLPVKHALKVFIYICILKHSCPYFSIFIQPINTIKTHSNNSSSTKYTEKCKYTNSPKSEST